MDLAIASHEQYEVHRTRRELERAKASLAYAVRFPSGDRVEYALTVLERAETEYRTALDNLQKME